MESTVKDHYNSDDLVQQIKTALVKAGISHSALTIKDLSPIDQLHTGGALSSINLFKKAGLNPGDFVLDAGCGMGGSARLLADQFNCKVFGIDLTDKFIEAAKFLTQCTGLEKSIDFQQGSVLDLPYEDNTFDVVLCQHILMNIKDKSTATKEFFRVLKPDGKLILHEITKGKNNDLVLPVPWASKPSISFLESWDILSEILERQGFQTVFCTDETLAACTLLEKVKILTQKRIDSPPPLNPGLIFGDNAKFFRNNMHTNFKKNAICLIEAVLKKSYDK
ncbi:MAG: class I SAM-dependent methyltransferase [Proteobacteria bacterium]|nr:class I SAM-dependent methyltransferase [Pseudomonadota bacterium]MBU1584742.1 class I SAM-dependent methyltransferase [Pseudomonadota bacterium]MBU2451876.1 class I SAM-dependent methyltransferase [Pseudomonadota bacterium]MBU2628803.1 class I SAM-dependent methyltransferase [Pseudomonadota bacterium]